MKRRNRYVLVGPEQHLGIRAFPQNQNLLHVESHERFENLKSDAGMTDGWAETVVELEL
jgi:hypothetical protein